MTEDILRAAELHRNGYDKNALRRMVKAGALTRVRRGAYTTHVPDDAANRHRLLVRAVVGELSGAAVVSHVSAAVLHGLPTWGLRLRRVHVTVDRRTGGRRDDRLHLHTAPLVPDEIDVVDGLAVTSVARTVTDVARTASFEAAVAVADAALRQTATADAATSAAALDAAVRRATGWPGAPAARRVVAFADGRSESVGESRSRVAIARAGLPTPVLQWPVRCAGSIAYTDFGWPELRTVGEFDGKIKYGRLVKPGQDPGDVVFAEKLREDAVRGQDLGVVRWTWPDLDDFAPTAARLRHRFRT